MPVCFRLVNVRIFTSAAFSILALSIAFNLILFTASVVLSFAGLVTLIIPIAWNGVLQ